MKKLLLILLCLPLIYSCGDKENDNVIKPISKDKKNPLDKLVTYEMRSEQYTGKGTWFADERQAYRGEFKNGLFEGEGTAIYDNGSKYEGEWKEGKKHGYGI